MKKIMSILLMLLMCGSVFAGFYNVGETMIFFNEPCDIRIIDYYLQKLRLPSSAQSNIDKNLTYGYACLYEDSTNFVHMSFTQITNDVIMSVSPEKDESQEYVWTNIIVPQKNGAIKKVCYYYADNHGITMFDGYLSCVRKILFRPMNGAEWVDKDGISQEEFIAELKHKEYVQEVQQHLLDPENTEYHHPSILAIYDANTYLTNYVSTVEVTNYVDVAVTNTIYETITETNLITITSHQTNIVEHSIVNITNIFNVIDCFVTNYTDEVIFTTNTIYEVSTNYIDQVNYITNVVSETQTNIVSISSIEHMQDSDVGKGQNDFVLQPGITAVARKTSSLIYDGDYCAGIVYLNIYKSSSVSKVKVDGKIAFGDGKVYLITAGYGKIVDGILSVSLKSGLGQCVLNVGVNGIMGAVANKYDVLPIIADANMGTLNGNLNFRYFDKSKGLVSRQMKVKGVAVSGEHLLIITDGKNEPYTVYGEKVK